MSDNGRAVDLKKAETPGHPTLEAFQPTVNSELYWSQRFSSDWFERGGREQSRFFYKLALDHLPPWLVRMILVEQLSICDWGCATGDGTDLLAQVLGVRVVGIDFANTAIAEARAHYSRPDFACVDLQAETMNDRFDMLFTSNTLEHFSEPWKVLEKISYVTRDLIVVLVPFAEYERHPEHESSFDGRSVPAVVAGRFQLLFSRVVETGRMRPSYWPGAQILLVYATAELARRWSLRLDDLSLEGSSSPGPAIGNRSEVADAGAPHFSGASLGTAQRAGAGYEDQVGTISASLATNRERLGQLQTRLLKLRQQRSGGRQESDD